MDTLKSAKPFQDQILIFLVKPNNFKKKVWPRSSKLTAKSFLLTWLRRVQAELAAIAHTIRDFLKILIEILSSSDDSVAISEISAQVMNQIKIGAKTHGQIRARMPQVTTSILIFEYAWLREIIYSFISLVAPLISRVRQYFSGNDSS